MSSYARVFCYTNGLYSPSDTEYYEKSSPDLRLTVEQGKEISQLKLATFLNMAQIDLFNGNNQKCVDRVNKAFKIEKTIKGHYRRGIAYWKLRNIAMAAPDFSRVLELASDEKTRKTA